MQRRRRTFVRRTLMLLAAGVASLVAVIATGLWAGEDIARRAQDVREAQAIKFRAETLLGRLRDAETGQRGYLLTGRGDFLDPYKDARRELESDLKALEQAFAVEAFDHDFTRIRANARAKMAELERTIDLVDANRQAEALEIVRSGGGKALMEALRSEIGEIILMADRRLSANAEAMHAASARLRIVTLIGGALALALGAAVLLLVRRFTNDLFKTQAELSDLTRTLEDRVETRTLDLTRANDEIQRFAYIVSHDLRAPLVNIMGFTSEMEGSLKVLTEGLPNLVGDAWSGAEARPMREALELDMPESVEFIRNSSKRMDGLINAILHISREGRRVLSPEPVALGDLFAQSTAALSHRAQALGCAFEIQSGMPTVIADRLALEQIFGNLLDNAIKYSAKGRAGRIAVRAVETPANVIVEVADNGRGIAEQDLERIFELFRRAGRQDQPGEGIGLAHVRALVRRLGGDITVESSFGEGSTFRVILPRRPKAQD